MKRIRYAELTALMGQRQPACGSTTVIALDGPSGSGKTRLADGLAEVTGGDVLHLDDLYPGWQGLEATPPMVRRVPPAGLLILDGVGSGAATLRPFLSLLLWVEAPLGVRRRRALSRDEGVYEPFWEMWGAQEARHFAAEQTRIRADRVIDTGD